MKKLYTLLGFILIGSGAFAQTKSKKEIQKKFQSGDTFNQVEGINYEFSDYLEKNRAVQYDLKDFGDTLYYEDFDLNAPLEWTITNVNQNINNFTWLHDDRYDVGAVTGTFRAMRSTSGGGMMILPSDSYNTPRGATQADDEEMNTYFTSNRISFTGARKSVFVSFEQWMIYCCNGLVEHDLEVSTDSLSWTTFDARDGLPVNSANAEAGRLFINVSEVVGDSTSLFLRFRARNNPYYFWMIDDILVTEGPKNDLEISDPEVVFHGLSYGITPTYTQIPYDLFPPLIFASDGLNNGWDTARDARLEVDVTHITDRFGTATNNTNPEYADYNLTNAPDGDLVPFPGTATYLVDNFPFVPLQNGEFQVDMRLISDSVDQVPGNDEFTSSFITTDTTFAKDQSRFFGSVGPGDYVDGGFDFDALGTIYNVESRSGSAVEPTSITFYLTADTFQVGMGFAPTIWHFYEDSSTIQTAWDHTGQNSIVADGGVYTVTANDLMSFVTLPVSMVDPNKTGLDSGQYVVGYESISGGKAGGDRVLSLGDDAGTAADQSPSTVVYLDNVNAKFFLQALPIIRLNVGNSPIQTGIENTKTAKNQFFEVIPNPNTGQFKINIATEGQTTYNLSIRNMLGQSVYNDVINVDFALTERVDLQGLEKGVYFVILENEEERLQKKVIIQ